MIKGRIVLNSNFTIGKIDERIYGGFIEHMFRAVYEGMYQPDHPSADEDGFRTDVLALVRELGPTIIRYPGGNFVSGYNWEDGIGSREKRPVRLDLAWKGLEPNTFGTDEFMKWCQRAGTAPLMTVNLGTGGPAEAQRLVEYCNFPGGTEWSERRKANGSEEPYHVKVWGLGNEMDGPWQTMHRSAEEYGHIAAEAAKMMKWTDPSIELVVCGSSVAALPTWGSWDKTVLEYTYDLVDYLAIHRYFGVQSGKSLDYLALPEQMEDFIHCAIAFCDAAGATKKSAKKLMLSFDEWNVRQGGGGARKNLADTPEWSVARPGGEDVYTMEDALLTGMFLSTFQNHADRVKIACRTQVVNVAAPIMTEKNGKAWRQTIFHPLAFAAKYGRGIALRSVVDSPRFEAETRPEFEPNEPRKLPYLYASCIHNAEKGEIVIFATNRNLSESMELEVRLEDFLPVSVIEHKVLHHSNLKAVNSEEGEEVTPFAQHDAALQGETLKAELLPASWNMLRIQLR